MKLLITTFFVLGSILPSIAQHQLLQERKYLTKPTTTEIQVSSADKLGNVYYSGLSWASIGNWDHYLLKVKPNSDTLWTKKSPTKIDDTFLTIQSLPGNTFIATSNTNAVPSIATIQKRNSAGNLLFTKSYNSARTLATVLLRYPNNDLLLGGYFGNKPFAFMRTDSVGNPLWTKGYRGGMSNGSLVDLKFSKDGNILAAGSSNYPIGPSHLKLLLLNQNGDSLLGKQLVITDPSNFETMYYNYNSITSLKNGSFLATATADTTIATTQANFWRGMIIKLDANLNIQWKYVHRLANFDEYIFTKSKELTDGSLLVLGYKANPVGSSNTNGFQLYRFSATGQLLSTFPFTSSICTQVSAITLDAMPDSTYLIGGGCGGTQPTGYGFYVAKVKIPGLPLPLPPVNISGIQEELITRVGLGQSYPNPTNSAATIPYQLPGNYRQASIIIREIATGREISKYELKRGESSLSVDVSSLSNGLYLYSLVVDEKQMATKKLAVMK